MRRKESQGELDCASVCLPELLLTPSRNKGIPRKRRDSRRKAWKQANISPVSEISPTTSVQ